MLPLVWMDEFWTSDTKRAEKLFAKYAECSDRFCACLSQGQSIEDLVKAV